MILSKQVLIIYPDLPQDYFISKISFPAARRVAIKAKEENWMVTILKGNNANRIKVTSQLQHPFLPFVLHFDHGDQNAISGQNNNNKEVVIDNTNVDKLQGKSLSTYSCKSACTNGIGSLAISKGGRAYLGYSDLYWVWFGENYCLCDFFINAANAANFALLEGKSFGQACQIGKDAHYIAASFLLQLCDIIRLYIPSSDELDDLIDDLETAAACLEWDGDKLTILGDPKEQAI